MAALHVGSTDGVMQRLQLLKQDLGELSGCVRMPHRGGLGCECVA